MQSVKREAGDVTVRYHEWFDFYVVKSLRLSTWKAPRAEDFEQTLFQPSDFPEEVVLFGMKVDTELPYPSLASLWVRITVGTSVYEYPCSAFDRAYPQYEIQKIDKGEKVKFFAAGLSAVVAEGDEPDDKISVKLGPPRFRLPLYTKEQPITGSLFVQGAIEPYVGVSHVTVTLSCLTKREVQPPADPPPNPELGYCVLCEGHPTHPRKVPAVTRTEDGRPRCQPCGRWVQ